MLKFEVAPSKTTHQKVQDFEKNRRPRPKIDAKQFVERKILEVAWNKSVDKVITAAMSVALEMMNLFHLTF